MDGGHVQARAILVVGVECFDVGVRRPDFSTDVLVDQGVKVFPSVITYQAIPEAIFMAACLPAFFTIGLTDVS